ncbi:MAG: CCC motif membrane protein [Bacteroidia bacterium]
MADETILRPEATFPQQSTPNSTAVLILGIVSIVTCWCWGIGIIPAIAAIFMASRGKKEYEAHPERFTVSSYNNLKAGKVVAIIGLILCVIVVLLSLISNIFFHDEIREMMEELQQQEF